MEYTPTRAGWAWSYDGSVATLGSSCQLPSSKESITVHVEVTGPDQPPSCPEELRWLSHVGARRNRSGTQEHAELPPRPPCLAMVKTMATITA